jgi:toxin secretion/phage lysis holin
MEVKGMNDKIFGLIVAGIGVTANHLWGEWSPLLQVLVLFVLVDYSTGLMASAVEGKLNSKVGFRGIPKKVMIFAMVAVGHAIDRALGDGHIFRDATIFFYLSNELLSIVENSGRLGLPVPDVIKRAVEVLKGKVKE